MALTLLSTSFGPMVYPMPDSTASSAPVATGDESGSAAFACRKLGQHAKAADYAAKAVGLDPETPAKTLLNSDN